MAEEHFLEVSSAFRKRRKSVDSKKFHALRQELQKTQKQISELLGTSLKAAQSFEQGWRKIPVHIERQMLFLMYMKKKSGRELPPCWVIRKCPAQTRQTCPAWEFNAGRLCWFINGTICRGKPREGWSQKMKTCYNCEVFTLTMKGIQSS